jgi:hypothetical protein
VKRTPYGRNYRDRDVSRGLGCGHSSARAADVDAADILAAVTGIALSVGKPGQREQAERLIALTAAGLTVTR